MVISFCIATHVCTVSKIIGINKERVICDLILYGH